MTGGRGQETGTRRLWCGFACRHYAFHLFLPLCAQVVVQEVEVEVESQKMAEHRQALENYSRAIEEQRNRLGQVMQFFGMP